MAQVKNESVFAAKLLAARKRVAEMDEMDGFKDRHLATIVAALRSGLANFESNYGSEFDALVMLEDLLDQERAK
jgi:hypothetical protein